VVEQKAPLDADGNMICMGCGKVMTKPDLDHYPSWRDRIRDTLFGSRKAALDDYNDTNRLRPLCPHCNRSHIFENTPTEDLPFYPE
jgi:hypothetical protein